jgi:hypothetical protein
VFLSHGCSSLKAKGSYPLLFKAFGIVGPRKKASPKASHHECPCEVFVNFSLLKKDEELLFVAAFVR